MSDPQDAPDLPTVPPQAAEPRHPWADLAAEQLRLLRLAPLPADRHTGARPLQFAEFGRVARHSKELSLLRLNVQLPGQRLREGQNLLEVWIDHRHKTVRFGPEGGLQVEPANRGLGRFLLAQGIAWARQQCAHYQVEGGALPARDLLAEEDRGRRDHCLQAQGFVVDYLDPLQLKARYGAPHVGALHGAWHTDKVQILGPLETAAMLQQADQGLREREGRIRRLEERIERFRHEDGSLRFTVGCLVAFSLFQAGLLLWIASR